MTAFMPVKTLADIDRLALDLSTAHIIDSCGFAIPTRDVVFVIVLLLDLSESVRLYKNYRLNDTFRKPQVDFA